jgi:20S proteasome subunit beta 3|eukprot:evm.model.NODE_22070_length_83641_cov_42.053585.31
MSDRLFVGLSGLATDIQTLEQLLRFRLNMYKLREERDIKPETFSALLSHILYEKRFGPYFVEPLVAGLKTEDNTPFISGMDLIGAPVFAKDFVVAGTCAANLYGLCESMWKPGLEPEELFEVLSQSLLASVDRDALSGWGAVVHIMYVSFGRGVSVVGRVDENKKEAGYGLAWHQLENEEEAGGGGELSLSFLWWR